MSAALSWPMAARGQEMKLINKISIFNSLSLSPPPCLVGHLVCVVLLLLPVRSLVKLYLYILTGLLLSVGHQTTR